MDLGALESRVGKAVIAAALWDDVLSLFLLALLLAAIGNGGTGAFDLVALLPVIGKVLLFFAITIPIGLFVFPVIGRYFRLLSFPEGDFSMLLIAALAYAVLAEYMELHLIIGAFLAGLFLQPDPPGVIVHSLFSAIVIMAVVTTVATPILLRRFWNSS